MKTWFLALSLLLSTTCWATVASYHNHNEANSYTDPYRQINRKGDNLEAVIIKELKEAKKSIYIAVQELRLPLIAQLLVEKQREGIDVRVVLEHDYNFNVLQQQEVNHDEAADSSVSSLAQLVDVNNNRKFEKSELETRDAIYMLQQARIPLIDDTSDGSRGSGLMHHKFIIIDGMTTIISTANFTLSCIHGDLDDSATRGNANSLVVAKSKSLADVFNQEFAQLWGNGQYGNFGKNKTYRGPQTVTVAGSKITVQFSPTSERFNWAHTVNGLIGKHLTKASKSVKAALFVFSDQKLANSLLKAQEKGAEIGVLIDPGFAMRYYSELLDLLGLQMIDEVKCVYEPDNNPWKKPITEGGMVILPKGDMLHHKFAVVDEKKVIIGSQNWSDSANYNNDETLIVVESKTISESYSQEYNRLKKSSLLGPSKKVLRQIEYNESVCADQGHDF